MTRPERRERWEAAFTPEKLALAGATLSGVLLFQPGLAGRLVILVAAAGAAWLSGRRLSPLTTLMVTAGIVAANLLVPLGRKLAAFGPILITEQALMEGIEKAVTFEALVFISKASLVQGLRLPGRLGAMFGQALGVYNRILAYRGRIRPKSFMADIDAALVAVYAETNDTVSIRVDESGHSGAARPGDRVLVPVIAALALTLLLP